MTNVLIALSNYLFGSFGLTIIVLTVIVNLLMFPLTLKQIRASKAMQELQPKLSELQKKYASDKQRLAQEQMKMYKESGLSPAGCAVPMLIQMPIWIALYQSIMHVLAVAPEGLLGLSKYLYSWPMLYTMLPLENQFLWLDLARGDTFLAILVGGTMWLQQKMVMTSTPDPKQQAQNTMMLWMMPLMFAFFTLSFPSGLALFWVTSNAIRIGIQYFVTGWGGLALAGKAKQVAREKRYPRRIAQVEEEPLDDDALSADIVESSSTEEKGLAYGESGDKRPDYKGGYPSHLRTARHRPKGRKSHRFKRR